MKRLILTSASGLNLKRSGRADFVIPFSFRFIGQPLPSPDELAAYVAARTEKHVRGSHWSDFVGGLGQASKRRKDLGLIEFCEPYETIEFWFDPDPNDQLQLIWLLDFFRSCPETAGRLIFRIVDFELFMPTPKQLGGRRVQAVQIGRYELEVASLAWRAYRATTPEACFDLLGTDLCALPLLRPALLDLLEELPSSATGLGATEMRLLELIARGYAHTNALFHLQGVRRRRVFNSFEIGFLLEGLAHGPTPAVAGLDDELRTLSRDNYGDRDAAYKRSKLSLTEFGKAVVAHKEDFSRHNPIDRWWGGTRLTNDRLWRWYTALTVSDGTRRPS